MHSLGLLVRLFWDICRFRRGPQDVPASDALLTMVLLGYALMSLLVLSFDYSPQDAITATLADVMFMLLSTAAILGVFGRQQRLRQTLSAYAGCGTLYNIAVVPLIWSLGSVGQVNSDGALPALLLQLLTVWALAVNTRILQRAIETTLINAFLLSLTLVVLNLQIVQMVLPTPSTGA